MRASSGRTGKLGLAAALLFLVAWSGPVAGSSGAESAGLALFAERLDAKNLAARRLAGPDAIAGLGDWVLGNGFLCAALSDPDHESTLSDRGGVLVDLGHCGRDDDQWVVLQPMVNLSRANTLPVETVRAESTDDEARIVTRGEANGLALTTVYAVDTEHPSRLRIETRVLRRGEGEAIFLLGDVALHGHRQLTAFTLSSGILPPIAPPNVGFTHPAVDVDSTLAIVDALVRADTQVLIGAAALEPPISYGWRIVDARVERADGGTDPLARIAMNGEHFSILGAYAGKLWFGGTGKPGFLELAQTLMMDLEPGDELVYVRELFVGRRADAASITDQLWATGAQVSGRVDDPTAGIHVFDDRDSPITFVRPRPDGRFDFRLPPARSGEYAVRVRLDDAVVAEQRFRVPGESGPIELDAIRTRTPAELVLPSGEPMRLVFVGMPPAVAPVFGTDGIVFVVGEERIRASTEASSISLAGIAGDPVLQRLPAARYRVLASRGPEWSVSETVVDLAPGQRTTLDIEPPVRVVEQPGFLSADLHVHSAMSDDSALPLRPRIAAFVAQGADVLVSTEHDNVIDYAPTIAAMGLADVVGSVVGVEVTSTVIGDVTPHTIGHSNAFPLVRDPDAYRGGAPRAENRRLRDVVADLRARPGRPLLQLNHPREAGVDSGLGSYLSHLAVVGEPFDPTRPLTAPGNAPFAEPAGESGLRDLDFDVIELLNGSSMDAYRLTRAAWFALILQGEFRPGTANSDSHDLQTVVALPRNYVAIDPPDGGTEAPGRLDPSRFLEAVRAGRLYGSTGPLLDVRLGSARPGGTSTERDATLRIDVRHADWVPVDEIRVFVDGALRHRAAVPERGPLVVPLHFEGDAFVTVEVEGRAEPTSTYGLIAPGFTPFAFTNPIFVDVDGEPGWTAPGLPDRLPPALASPLDSP